MLVRSLKLTLLLAALSAVPICHAQIVIDDYGFYRSWRELNDRFFAGEVELDARGLEPGTDLRTDKMSDNGLFRVSVELAADADSKTTKPPFNQIHSWRLRVVPEDDYSTESLQLEFYGGMPLHNHGFPTNPIISPGSEPGLYRLEGIKFSMSGWWQFALAIKTAAQVDTVRFNLVIQP